MTETGETAPDSKPAAKAQHPLAQRRHLARLRGLAGRLDHQSALIRNGGRDPRAEARAGKLADEAFAIRWALRRIAPETEGNGQPPDGLGGTGVATRRPT